MKIELKYIKIRDLVKGYEDKQARGVYGYDGNLNIRPEYQREFVYKEAQRNAVLDSVVSNKPLNVMYWMDSEDGTYELMDGQQRTISVCQYVTDDFSIKHKYFHNLDEVEQNKILDYKLMVYFCTGSDAERLDWFKTINIAGEKLTNQELLNAVYTGKWLANAKDYFSKTNCAASVKAKTLLKGYPIRQDYLSTVLKWVSNENIEDYMAKHQKDANAKELWSYFEKVIDWFESLFSVYRKGMKGLPIGLLYNKYKDKEFDFDLEDKVKTLMLDEDIGNKSGIYSYIITGDEKYLNIRSFSENAKREVYEEQNGLCIECDGTFKIEEMEADHIIPWSKGGKTDKSNLQLLCRKCNRIKSNH